MQERRVDVERVAMLFKHAPIALATVVLNSTILIAFLWSQVSHQALLAWAATLVLVTAVRTSLVVAYRRNPVRYAPRIWENAFAVGALFNGIAWGLGITAFLDISLEYQVGVLFVIGGMIAGASSSSATSPRSFWAYTAPAALPVLGRLLVEGSYTHFVLGGTSSIFIAAMTRMAQRSGHVVVNAIRVKFENADLAAELALRSRERAGRLQHLLDHAGVVTLVADPATSEVKDASQNVGSFLPFEAEALIGRPLVGASDFPPFADADGWLDLIRQARSGKTSVTATVPPSKATGPHIRHMELTATIKAVAGIDYVLLVLKDITERRALEAKLAQAHLLASLGTLSTGVAHEVNNPLAAVVTNLRLVRSALDRTGRPSAHLSSLVDDSLNDAIESAERIRETLSSLLTPAMDPMAAEGAVGSAGASTSPRSDPRQLTEMLLRVVDTEIRHRTEIVLDAEPIPHVRAAPLQVYQVLLPLVMQAVQAIADADASRNRIIVRLRDEPHTRCVRIEVEDTGQGLSPDEAAGIFEPFSSGRGAGLALSLCRDIATELGGRVSAIPLDGHGARLVLHLPAAATETPTASPTSAPQKDTLRILIVDDDPHVLRALARLMRHHAVITETSPRQALERLAEDTFDVILCDVMMPDMSGMQFYRAVQDAWPTIERRIIFMTGGTFADRAEEFMSTVDNVCLPKPFDTSALEAAIRHTMARSAIAPPTTVHSNAPGDI